MFYGALLGMQELEKPESLRARGGVWFAAGAQEVHVGVEEAFTPARKAHPGLVARNLVALGDRLRAAGYEPQPDEAIPGLARFFVTDPFGNRLEIRQGE